MISRITNSRFVGVCAAAAISGISYSVLDFYRKPKDAESKNTINSLAQDSVF